jgi:imidazolonepropionase-like amidohydrolase
MRFFSRLLLVLSLLMPLGLSAQVTFPQNGPHDPRPELHAFTNATLWVRYDQKIEKATLLIREGRVEKIGTDVEIPAGAVVHDLSGKWVYPAFVELYANYGQPEPRAVGGSPSESPQMLNNQKGAYSWNEALKNDYRAHTQFAVDAKTAQSLRAAGFGAALSHRFDGIARGSGTLVLLGEEKEHLLVLRDLASRHFSFRKGTSTQDYPSSLMGAIALLRQAFYDAKWYADGGKEEEYNISLDTWNQLDGLPAVFDVRDRLEALRAAKIGREFDLKFILKGSGDEYQRLDEIQRTGCPLIVPVNFPKAYDLEDPYEAELVALGDMLHWEMAPSNAARLAQAQIPFALTAAGLEKKETFLAQVRKAVRFGLSKEAALKALTETPARLIRAEDDLGSLEKGRLANFIVASGDLFDDKTTVHQVWVRGQSHDVKPDADRDPRGEFQLSFGNQTLALSVKGTPEKPVATLRADTLELSVTLSVTGNSVGFSFSPNPKAPKKIFRFTGVMDNDLWSGIGMDSLNARLVWTAKRTAAFEPPAAEEQKPAPAPPALGQVLFPFMGYGRPEITTRAERVLFRNATVWTNEAEGILPNTDVLLENGRIAAIGKNLEAGRGARVIDATGKHLTAGIIDEHSHIAISRGVNEGTQASSAEVRIGDVVNSDDINIYRNLSGGVTACQLLHGSANPIGGQSALIKLRWGYAPEDMKIDGAKGYIKFALGENVKQSNWGENNRTRFPQTRMGVEQVYEDHFTRAREYAAQKGRNKRRDLELDALVEILQHERFITCHSYVQSEIAMLMKVATRFGFTINTFTHVLEGYKVADKMAAHGVGGSSFADWWAYKFEVKDAIPYNPAILMRMGVVTAVNSDDAEMSRRLNQEAAKAVKYGGLSEEEAWKLVTLNPAKLLRLDQRMGSVKTGKDADVVLWSENPLSMYARAENTFVDGIEFFSREKDLTQRAWIAAERARLIQKMVAEKNGGGDTQRPVKKEQRLWDCEDVDDALLYD